MSWMNDSNWNDFQPKEDNPQNIGWGHNIDWEAEESPNNNNNNNNWNSNNNSGFNGNNGGFNNNNNNNNDGNSSGFNDNNNNNGGNNSGFNDNNGGFNNSGLNSNNPKNGFFDWNQNRNNNNTSWFSSNNNNNNTVNDDWGNSNRVRKEEDYDDNNSICFICGSEGHRPKDCPKRSSEGGGRDQYQNKGNNGGVRDDDPRFFKKMMFRSTKEKTEHGTEFRYHNMSMMEMYRNSQNGQGVCIDEIRWFQFVKPMLEGHPEFYIKEQKRWRESLVEKKQEEEKEVEEENEGEKGEDTGNNSLGEKNGEKEEEEDDEVENEKKKEKDPIMVNIAKVFGDDNVVVLQRTTENKLMESLREENKRLKNMLKYRFSGLLNKNNNAVLVSYEMIESKYNVLLNEYRILENSISENNDKDVTSKENLTALCDNVQRVVSSDSNYDFDERMERSITAFRNIQNLNSIIAKNDCFLYTIDPNVDIKLESILKKCRLLSGEVKEKLDLLNRLVQVVIENFGESYENLSELADKFAKKEFLVGELCNFGFHFLKVFALKYVLDNLEIKNDIIKLNLLNYKSLMFPYNSRKSKMGMNDREGIIFFNLLEFENQIFGVNFSRGIVRTENIFRIDDRGVDIDDYVLSILRKEYCSDYYLQIVKENNNIRKTIFKQLEEKIKNENAKLSNEEILAGPGEVKGKRFLTFLIKVTGLKNVHMKVEIDKFSCSLISENILKYFVMMKSNPHVRNYHGYYEFEEFYYVYSIVPSNRQKVNPIDGKTFLKNFDFYFKVASGFKGHMRKSIVLLLKLLLGFKFLENEKTFLDLDFKKFRFARNVQLLYNPFSFQIENIQLVKIYTLLAKKDSNLVVEEREDSGEEDDDEEDNSKEIEITSLKVFKLFLGEVIRNFRRGIYGNEYKDYGKLDLELNELCSDNINNWEFILFVLKKHLNQLK